MNFVLETMAKINSQKYPFFDKLNIPEKIKDDPEESILVLDKCLFELCTSSIEKRKKVLGALKNTNRRKC